MAEEEQMSHPDEGLIHAWLDGELSAEEAARVQRLSETDAAWQAAVVEARGLIAASSRIVHALDAVPGGVVPMGTRAAPWGRAAGGEAGASRRFRVRPWMGIAAGLVLVAGTTFLLRDTPEGAFGVNPAASAPDVAASLDAPRAAVDVFASPAVSAIDATPSRPADLAAGQGTVGGVGGVAAGARGLGGDASGSSLIAPSPSAAAPSRRVLAEGTQPRNESELDRRAVAHDATPAPTPAPSPAVARSAAEVRAPSASERSDLSALGATTAKTAAFVALDGCWRVSTPDSLVGVLRAVPILRSTGDTLTLAITATQTVVVVRRDSTLTGDLSARLTRCPVVP